MSRRVVHHRLGTYRRLELIEPTVVIKQADGISCNQSTQRVADDAQLFDSLSVLRQLFQCLLNLPRDPFSAELDAIVGETAGVALGDKYVEFRVALP